MSAMPQDIEMWILQGTETNDLEGTEAWRGPRRSQEVGAAQGVGRG